jgi:hypothetical protein
MVRRKEQVWLCVALKTVGCVSARIKHERRLLCAAPMLNLLVKPAYTPTIEIRPACRTPQPMSQGGAHCQAMGTMRSKPGRQPEISLRPFLL